MTRGWQQGVALRYCLRITCSEKKKFPFSLYKTYNYHTVPLRGSRLRRGHKGVMSTVMGRPCGRALPLFNVVLRSTSFAWALGDTYRACLDCLERVSAQGGISNVHRWYTDLFYHRGWWFLEVGWYLRQGYHLTSSTVLLYFVLFTLLLCSLYFLHRDAFCSLFYDHGPGFGEISYQGNVRTSTLFFTRVLICCSLFLAIYQVYEVYIYVHIYVYIYILYLRCWLLYSRIKRNVRILELLDGCL